MGADMELVRQFNSEMASIYENKPPISKAKMASITRFAVKALKHYKHIVHSVEKFLDKCHPDYKLPGLYVLDSIIRQSRHQFGLEKDLFGPRFQKNITSLFQNIYQCPQEEKPKVVRVLNLWQRNGIYSPEVISPLVDMASTPSKVLIAQIHKHKKKKMVALKPDLDDSLDPPNSFLDDSLPLPMEPMETKRDKKRIQMSQDDEIQVLKAQLEQQRKQQELLQQQLQMQIMATKQQALQLQLQQQQMQNKIQEQMQKNSFDVFQNAAVVEPTPNATVAAAALATQNNSQMQLLNQIQELTQQLEKDKATLAQLTNAETVPPIAAPAILPVVTPAPLPMPSPVVAPNPPLAAAENHTQFLENFQQLIQSAKGIMLKDPRQQNNVEGRSHEESSPKFNQALLDTFEYDEDNVGDEQRIQEQKNRLEEEQNRLKRQDRDPRSVNDEHQPPQKKPMLSTFPEINHLPEQSMQTSQDDDAMQIDNDSEEYTEDDLYRPEQSLVEENHHPQQQQRKEEWPPHHEMLRCEDRNVAEEERERAIRDQREAERKSREAEENWKKEKSVMPPPMMNRLTVASTTLWIGRLPRGIHPSILHNIFCEHGEVKNIDMIEMRGCAFITMGTRFNADRALRHMRNRRIEGCDVKVAWGQPKTLQEFNKFWEEQFGCAFIPWGAFKPFHLRFFMDGAIVDKDTLPSGLDVPIIITKPPPEEQPPPENNIAMPPRMPQFQPRGPNPVMPQHGLPPGMPPPDMLPPLPPMMPPGFRGQFPPLPLPGMLPLGMRPPIPPVGMPPWPGNLQPPPGGIHPPGLPQNPRTPPQGGPKPPMLTPDQMRMPHQNGKDLISLLPPPPPMPSAPPNIRGPSFPRPDLPPNGMPGRPGFIPIPRSETPPPFSRPPPASERQRFPPPQQTEIRPPHIEPPRSDNDQPVAPAAPPIQMPLWNNNNSNNNNNTTNNISNTNTNSTNSNSSSSNNNNNLEKKSTSPIPEKAPFSITNSDIIDQLKRDKLEDKSDRSSDHSRTQTPEKNRDDRERRSREEFRDSDRKDKKDRNENRRDDSRSDRRDRDRDERRDRDDREERRDRDDREDRSDRRDRDERDERRRDRDGDRDRGDRNRKGRDDRNERIERDYRSRDDRDSRRGERNSGRDKYGKDEFGRDESNRDEDRGRRDDVARDEERNRREDNREEDKTRRRERSPEKLKTKDPDSGRERSREPSGKSDEVSSSSDKKEFPVDVKGQGLSGFKPTMQPVVDIPDGKTSPRLPTIKSGFKSTLQPVNDGFKPSAPLTDNFKPAMMLPVIRSSSDEFKTIAPTGSKSVSSRKGKTFIPFSIFPLPTPDDDEDELEESNTNETTEDSKKSDSDSDAAPSKPDTADNDDDKDTRQEDELYDPLEVASPTPETQRGNSSVERAEEMDEESEDPASSGSAPHEDIQHGDTLSDINSSVADMTADNNASPNENVSPDRGSPNEPHPLDIFAETSPTVEQSADVVTSSGDLSVSESTSMENNSLVEPSSGVVSSSADPPFKDDSKGNSSSEPADIVTSTDDQIMDTSVTTDNSDAFNVSTVNDGDQVNNPSSTTALDADHHKVDSESDRNSSDASKPCSTEAPCESSGITENKSISSGDTEDVKDIDCNDTNDYLKSPESNSQVSTSNPTNEEGPSSDNDITAKTDSDSNADCTADDSRDGETETYEVNTEENFSKMEDD